MGRHFLVLTLSAFVLTCGVLAASAQQATDVPTMQQQPQNLQEQLQRQLQGTTSSRQVVRDWRIIHGTDSYTHRSRREQAAVANSITERI